MVCLQTAIVIFIKTALLTQHTVLNTIYDNISPSIAFCRVCATYSAGCWFSYLPSILWSAFQIPLSAGSWGTSFWEKERERNHFSIPIPSYSVYILFIGQYLLPQRLRHFRSRQHHPSLCKSLKIIIFHEIFPYIRWSVDIDMTVNFSWDHRPLIPGLTQIHRENLFLLQKAIIVISLYEIQDGGTNKGNHRSFRLPWCENKTEQSKANKQTNQPTRKPLIF